MFTAGILPTVMGGGIGVGMLGTYAQGQTAEAISEQRAAADRANAKAAREIAQEKAELMIDDAKHANAALIASAAGRGIDVGHFSSSVHMAEVKARQLKEMGYTLKAGLREAEGYETSAVTEEMTGKYASNQAWWNMISQGLSGATTAAYLFG